LHILRDNTSLTSREVAVSTGCGGYPSAPPYSPGKAYPEYPFAPVGLADQPNETYDGVREALRLLRLDEEHYGRTEWNPLGRIIRPGNTVVLKPNFIRDFRETQAGHDDCLITHGSIIRAALDYVYLALRGQGRIIIADAPQNEADFAAIRRMTGLDGIQEFYSRFAGFGVEVYDLRPEKAAKVDGVIVGHDQLAGDPAGYVKVDLNRHSMFREVSHLSHLFYGSEYDTTELQLHHHGDTHEYLVSGTILAADCIINLPKLKTHKKTGITVCLKNLVGINGNKNWLPHHRLGTPAQGGDQFADDGVHHRAERAVMACFRRLFPLLGPVRTLTAKPLKALGQRLFGDTNLDTIRSGNWYGNDTTWRMVLDLNRILMYADSTGRLRDTPVRRMLCMVDGIIGGEGNGPLDPTPKKTGVVLAGLNGVCVDLVCAEIMGFDCRRLPLLNRSFDTHPLPLVSGIQLDNVVVLSNDERLRGRTPAETDFSFSFVPHFGWRGHIERKGNASVSMASASQP
jgi:uncharacterized protein (DUF362 family)